MEFNDSFKVFTAHVQGFNARLTKMAVANQGFDKTALVVEILEHLLSEAKGLDNTKEALLSETWDLTSKKANHAIQCG